MLIILKEIFDYQFLDEDISHGFIGNNNQQVPKTMFYDCTAQGVSILLT